jgi:hypothetical protein
VRGLGSRETRSNDMLSLLMFQPDYIARAIELGESDARARSEEIDAFLRQDVESRTGATFRETLVHYRDRLRRRLLRHTQSGVS